MVGVVLNKFDLRAANYAYHSSPYGSLEYYGSGSKQLQKPGTNQA
jgi:hypothetical protein